jgi:hypothetical protein
VSEGAAYAVIVGPGPPCNPALAGDGEYFRVQPIVSADVIVTQVALRTETCPEMHEACVGCAALPFPCDGHTVWALSRQGMGIFFLPSLELQGELNLVDIAL